MSAARNYKKKNHILECLNHSDLATSKPRQELSATGNAAF